MFLASASMLYWQKPILGRIFAELDFAGVGGKE